MVVSTATQREKRPMYSPWSSMWPHGPFDVFFLSLRDKIRLGIKGVKLEEVADAV